MSEELQTLLGSGADVAGRVGNATAVEESETVLKTDRWTKRTGIRLAQEWSEVGVEGVTPEDVNLAADSIETLLASRPSFAELPADAKRARWWEQLVESPETAALRSRTVLNPAVAELAAASLASQYVNYAKETAEDPNEGDDEGIGSSMKRIRSTRQAIEAATEMADDAEAVSAGLGMGSGSTLESKKIAAYTRRLRGASNMLHIMKLAGRFIARAQQLQRQRSDLPGMEITGVELSGDVSRLLPYESVLVAGAVPELEMLAMARLAQRRSLSYRRVLRTPMAMGPIVVSIDESGSMASGGKIEAAKGLALAMASIARAQRRPFLLCAFSGTPQIRTAGDSPEAIIEWIESFMNGGTVLDGPLQTLPTTAWPAGKVGARSDHIIITDDEVDLDDEQLSSYQKWAKGGSVRTFGIGIGVRTTETLARVCDGGVWALPNLDLDSSAVTTLLSIGPTYKELH